MKKTQKDENPVTGEKILFYYNNNNATQARGRPVPGQKPREMCGHDKKNDAGEDTFDDNELKNESAFSSQACSVPLLPTGCTTVKSSVRPAVPMMLVGYSNGP